MNIVIFGLSLTSSWGNGHATTYRALCRALHACGHRIAFFERDTYWYRDNRDLPTPDFCELYVYETWPRIAAKARAELRDADLAIIGSFFPDPVAIDEVFASPAAVKAFYDIDTPITVAALRRDERTDYLRREQIPHFDLYLSFTGGPILREIERDFGAPLAAPLYCSFDPSEYRPRPRSKRYASDLSYMGTYAPDRQPKIQELLSEPARRLPQLSFLVAGPQYPRSVRWPKNVRRINHLNPRWHPTFYSSSRLTLNVTRRDMVQAGYSPSVRLFEAAACGAAIMSDNWPGLDTFFTPGREILLAATSDDSVHCLSGIEEAELRRIGEAARARVLAEHTSDRRAQQLEELASRVMSARSAATHSIAV